MAAFRVFLLTVFLSVILAHVGAEADASVSDVVEEVKLAGSDGPDSVVLEQLKSKIHSLESQIEEKIRELKEKEHAPQKIIDDQKAKICKTQRAPEISEEELMKAKFEATSRTEDLMQPHGAWLPPWLAVHLNNYQKLVPSIKEKWVVIATNIEPHVHTLTTKTVEIYEASKEAVSPHIVKVQELANPYYQPQKIIDDQKAKICKTQRAPEISEEELMKAKFDATSRTEELMQPHGAWLPPWLAVHLNNYQKLVPSIKEKWVVIATNIEPHVHTLTTKTVEIYEASKEAVSPHIVKVQELANPYYQPQKIIDDQKAKICKTQRAPEISEEELMKAKFEATSRTDELMQPHGAWLPPWLAVHLNNYQKLVPSIKEKWVVIATNIEPHVHTLTTKTLEIYEASKEAVSPHIVKVQELANPYYQPQKIIDDQKANICKTQRAPEISEEELMKAKFEATSRTEDLMQPHGAWLPPWLAVHLNNYQKLVPSIKEKWVVIATNIEPHVHTLTTKTLEIYEASKEAVSPHIVKVQELANPYYQPQKIIDDQKANICKTQRAPEISEEELMKAKFEATSRTEDLMQPHGAWLPPWLAVHLNNYQKLVPSIKEKWVVIATNIEPHVHTLTTKTLEIYEASKEAVSPHIVKVQELANPYYQPQKIIDDQKAKICKTQRAPEISEEELMKAKFEATSRTEELMHPHGAWLPPWLAVHLNNYQKLVPSIKEKWVVIATNIEPHVHTLTIKTVEIYEASKEAVTSHIVKVQELANPYYQPQKIIDDQKAKIRKTQRALEISEEELMKAKFEATSRTEELMQPHGAWLPPWLAVHLNNYQKLVPSIKEKWVVIATNIEPHVHTLTTKTVEIYEASKEAVTPHIVKVQELANPYYQELRKVSRPYIDSVATAARPHVDKLQTNLKPYTQEAVKAYRKFLESATVYHGQVQDSVQDKLKSREFTKPLATKELVWFSASALLALPIILLLKIFSAFFGKKGKKATRHGNTHNARL
ncbi:uncharacterized protein LOC121784695 isoform X1 [Salvia splendens]|uniref:uncharacterized protein LOC121784695 isoform X1 n=2 Tax=Salvia splendens TaxID=180675 RepID=UPI001C2749CA|nr:uncharacterized protein LOC121784695 isoform X1 [Salvia splendens]